jgi:sugar phosphate isomerase/epimerase
MPDASSLAVHTATLKQFDLPTCLEKLVGAGVGGVSVWRDSFDELGIDAAAKLVRQSGLRVPALVRGGFFVASDAAKRAEAVEENLRCLDEAEALQAEMVVLVVGAEPGVPLAEARDQVRAGIEACLPHAEQTGVRLAIEPLHPMYAADRSCINRLGEARAICEALEHPLLGVAVDAYHVWWDPDLEAELERLGRLKALFGYHVCDWKVQTDHLLLDRGLMGEGVIDLARLGRLVREHGFVGLDECEIFSTRHWQRDGDEWLNMIVDAHAQTC